MQFRITATHLSSIIILLHLIGVIGISIPQTRELVISLTPIHLILSLGLLIAGSKTPRKQLVKAFLPIFLIGLIVEIIGVQTGFPFGEYVYGKVMGLQIMDTPVVIGVNWFLLSYLFYFITQKINNKVFQIFLASALMTLMDVLIEPIAIKLNYWTWTDNTVPFSNYLAWFIIAMLMQLILTNKLENEKNKVAITLLITQVVFFCLLFFPEF